MGGRAPANAIAEKSIAARSENRFPFGYIKTGVELFNMAASQFRLRERGHFGLKWYSSEQESDIWINLDAKLLDQLPKKAKECTLQFCVRFVAVK